MNTSKGTERVNDDGAVEIAVETVDYRTPPGLDKEPIPEKVEVTHVIHADDHSAGTAGVVAEAAVKVAEKIQSVKEAVTGGGNKTE
ncbi:hypothetical protein MIMGU_mgv1a017269mg [Erythranthe guttata]|uniref:Uncharacterized protein n=1 Tax=Erythranthe guttata TaxID=4155 RepID=A0A022QC15_ERYGU|nr:PREDICTED: uncharacterized protein LOC105971293 [Erythranthe guttata]EYU25471.1 hypothetical protein MIMGU_mgv1a017269mg [Erythranthe guttata]|eukprot:XP_012851594.1 PREDICTED: uncharacterized protein LOC105971293 [Erythranthe guttata]